MTLDDILQLLARDPAAPLDIAEIALYLARDEYPQLDIEAHLGEINAMAHEARAYVRGDLAAQLHGFCRYLFHEMGFRGNPQNYYDPQNSYLNVVLERRTGIPITLSVVAMAVGNRAGLDIHGVGLPGHFIAKAVQEEEELLFDPFHGGRRLTVQDCEHLVNQTTSQPFQIAAAHLRALPPAGMVQRMLNNLKAIYLGEADFARGIRIIERLRQLEPHNPQHHRDLGVCYIRSAQPGKAIDHLQSYLAAVPQASDAEAVKNLLQQARRSLAQWN